MTAEVRINIGAGRTYIPGFSNIDVSPKADISIDIGTERLPFDDDSVDLVFSYHTLEHIPDYLFALGEIHRVLRHGGRLLLGVPYITSTEYNLVNPYHLHHFNEFSFDFFEPGKLRGSAAETNEICFKKVFHRFHYTKDFKALSEPMRTWFRRHLFNVVKKIDFGLLAIKQPNAMLHSDDELRRAMQSEFDDCFQNRTKYGA